MTPRIKKTLFWSPRILLGAFATFIIIFSFDVFGEAKGFKDLAIGLFMHNLPTLVLYAFLYFTWRLEWIGAIFFPLLGCIYIYWAWHRFPLSVYFIIAGPLFLVGILYLLNWIYRKELRPTAPSLPVPPAAQLPEGNL